MQETWFFNFTSTKHPRASLLTVVITWQKCETSPLGSWGLLVITSWEFHWRWVIVAGFPRTLLLEGWRCWPANVLADKHAAALELVTFLKLMAAEVSLGSPYTLTRAVAPSSSIWRKVKTVNVKMNSKAEMSHNYSVYVPLVLDLPEVKQPFRNSCKQCSTST